MSILERHLDVMTRLAKEVVACSPPDWVEGTLSAEYKEGLFALAINSDSSKGEAQVSVSLGNLVHELYCNMTKHDEEWSNAWVNFKKVGDKVNFSTSFLYTSGPSKLGIPVDS